VLLFVLELNLGGIMNIELEVALLKSFKDLNRWKVCEHLPDPLWNTSISYTDLKTGVIMEYSGISGCAINGVVLSKKLYDSFTEMRRNQKEYIIRVNERKLLELYCPCIKEGL
jgi:hypothetical protein